MRYCTLCGCKEIVNISHKLLGRGLECRGCREQRYEGQESFGIVFKLVQDAEKHEFKPNQVDHPSHYAKHPSGVECITVTEHFNFNRGNAIKYIWRAGEKGDEIEDLKKAAWYIAREIQRLEWVNK